MKGIIFSLKLELGQGTCVPRQGLKITFSLIWKLCVLCIIAYKKLSAFTNSPSVNKYLFTAF